MKTIHELKTWPEFFKQTRNGRKRFELRRNDRGYKVGDELLLKEWNPPPEVHVSGVAPIGIYTGRDLLVRVNYIMTAEDVVSFVNLFPAGYVIMSISLV
jgi:hypothetical protein